VEIAADVCRAAYVVKLPAWRTGGLGPGQREFIRSVVGAARAEWAVERGRLRTTPAGRERSFAREVGHSKASTTGKVPIDADITIRTMRGGARDLDGVKDPGKCNPTQGFLAIETARLTDIPNQVCQCRHEQGREYWIPDGHVLLSGFVETHCE
jgi:hypothetical protein